MQVEFSLGESNPSAKITSGITQFSETVMSRVYDLTIGRHTKDCRFDPEAPEVLKRSFGEMKLMEGEADMSKLHTEAYLPK